MNLFRNAQAWMRTKLVDAAGVSVTYTRKATGTPLTINAVIGRTVFSSNLSDTVRVEFGDRDYLVDVDQLPAQPAIGDRITETLDGQTHVYEVTTPQTGEPAWRWSDPQCTIYRIHTTRKS